MAALRTASLLLLLFVLHLVPAKAADEALPGAAASIEQLIKDGKLTEAEALAARSAKSLQADPSALSPADTASLAATLSNLAYALAASRKVPDALVFMQQVATLRERVLGASDPALAEALNDEGILLKELARYADAETVLTRALSIREKQSDADALVAQTLNNLAQAKKRLGKVAEAEKLLRRTSALQEKALGPDDPALGDTLADVADILAANGRAAEADPLARRALAITEKALGPDDPEVARRLIKLANATAGEGRFKEAEALFRRALAIRGKAFGNDSQQAAGVLSNLANVILADERPAEAEPILRQALDLQIKLRGPDHPAVGTSLNRLANALREEKRFDDADPVYVKAIAVLSGAFGEEHPLVAAAIEDFGNLRFKQGRFVEALDLFRRAGEIIRTREEAGDPVKPDAGILPRTQGAVFRWIAETGFEIADRDESKRSDLGTEAYLAIQRFTQSRTGVSLEQVAARVGRSEPALRDLVRKRESLTKQWQAAEAGLIDALGKGGAAAGNAAGRFTETMTRVEAEIGEVDARIAHDFPDFSELIDPKPLSVPDTEGLLGPDEALVTFAINDTDTLIWVITKERLVWVHSPVGEKALTALVEKLRAGVATEDADFDLAAAHQLYAALIGPDRVQASLAGKKHLIVIPSGPLTSLPFQVLVSDPPPAATDPDRYRKAAWLIRRYALSVLPSVSSLRILRRAAAGDEAQLPFIGLGDPVFKLPGVEPPAAGSAGRGPAIVSDFYREQVPDQVALARGLPELPETADELKKVSATLHADPDSVIIRETASEATLKTFNKAGALQNYRVVYFATHGLVAGEVEKLLSFRAEPALALSLPADAERDRRRPAHRERGRRPEAQRRLGSSLRLQHRRRRQARGGGAFRPRPRLLLCRRAQPPRLALEREFGGGRDPHHRHLRQARRQQGPHQGRGDAPDHARHHRRQQRPCRHPSELLGALLDHRLWRQPFVAALGGLAGGWLLSISGPSAGAPRAARRGRDAMRNHFQGEARLADWHWEIAGTAPGLRKMSLDPVLNSPRDPQIGAIPWFPNCPADDARIRAILAGRLPVAPFTPASHFPCSLRPAKLTHSTERGMRESSVNIAVSPGSNPALVLNADYRPLSYYPLSLWSWQDAIKAVFLERVNIVSEYEVAVRSPSFSMKLPSVVSLKSYVRPARHPAFTRFNVFLRDRFECQYCGDTRDLTFDHLIPRSRGGHTTWDNVVTACSTCNLRKGGKRPPRRACGRADAVPALGRRAAQQWPALPAELSPPELARLSLLGYRTRAVRLGTRARPRGPDTRIPFRDTSIRHDNDQRRRARPIGVSRSPARMDEARQPAPSSHEPAPLDRSVHGTPGLFSASGKSFTQVEMVS